MMISTDQAVAIFVPIAQAHAAFALNHKEPVRADLMAEDFVAALAAFNNVMDATTRQPA